MTGVTLGGQKNEGAKNISQTFVVTSPRVFGPWWRPAPLRILLDEIRPYFMRNRGWGESRACQNGLTVSNFFEISSPEYLSNSGSIFFKNGREYSGVKISKSCSLVSPFWHALLSPWPLFLVKMSLSRRVEFLVVRWVARDQKLAEFWSPKVGRTGL